MEKLLPSQRSFVQFMGWDPKSKFKLDQSSINLINLVGHRSYFVYHGIYARLIWKFGLSLCSSQFQKWHKNNHPLLTKSDIHLVVATHIHQWVKGRSCKPFSLTMYLEEVTPEPNFWASLPSFTLHIGTAIWVWNILRILSCCLTKTF